MPRPPRYNEIGIYHIINRGVERRDIFLQQSDYDQFMTLMGDLVTKYGIAIHAFCLMTNHYHILLETVSDNPSEAIKHLNTNYSKYFNQTNQRSGHLWQGRFKSYPIYNETQFWTVAKYIERNPIAAGIVREIEGYLYQSYLIASHSKHSFQYLIEESKIHSMGLREYREYIDAPLQSEWIKLVYKTYRVNKNTANKSHLERSLCSFFDGDGERNDKIRESYQYGYTQSDIAEYLGLSRMMINKIIKR